MKSVLLLLALMMSPCAANAQTQPARAAPERIETLLEALAETDPLARQQAAEQLIALGAAARGDLLDALDSDNPEIRARAGEILRELPWHVASDPPPVREILAKYGQMEEGQRFIAAGRLAALPEHQGHEALIRLATEEPSARVRWLVVGVLRERSMYGPAKRRLREFDNSEHSALLLLAGWGWWQIDTQRACRLLEKAVDMELADWKQPNAEMLLALATLIEEVVAHDDYQRAVELTRKQVHFADAADSEDEPSADPAMALLALHAEHGPLAGFADDIDAHGPIVARRATLYVVARLLKHWGCWNSAQSIAGAARDVNQPTQQDHLAVGDFLTSRNWNDWAEEEYQAAIAQAGGENDRIIDAAAQFRLSRLAADQKRESAAADHMQEAMRLIGDAEEMLLRGDGAALADNAIASQILWRRWRAARQAENIAEAEKHLAELIRRNPDDIEIAIEIVPVLQAAGRAADADKIFDAAYRVLKNQLDAEPENPEHMNNLAWLCARCDRRLEEALELSSRAIAESPENYAYLDTAAEAHFRKGNPGRAVELEEKALRFRPKDPFMREQLERFRAGR